ncbi:MAG: glycosyltransferase family 39 protein [Pseudolabrys sp.]
MDLFSTRSAGVLADRVAISILVIVAIIASVTFRDYGLGWDDYTHSQYGDLLLKLYASGFADTRALEFVNLYKYGGGFDMAAALAAKVLPFDLFETRRLIGAVVGILGLCVTWRLGRRIGGPLAGCVALLLLASCPLYYGHMFMNPKDAPFATAFVVLLLGIVRGLDEYPKPNPRTVVLAGIGLGLAIGSRILAGMIAPAALAALLFIVVAETRARSWTYAAQRCGQFIGAMLPALGLGYLIMGLLWPWSIVAPLNPLHAAEYFDTFFEKPWEELYRGQLFAVPDMPLSYLPTLFLLKLPEVMLALGLTGIVGALIVTAQRGVSVTRRAGLIVIILAIVLPIAVAMALRPALYNGLRHFIFVVPPFAVLGGMAAMWLVRQLRNYGPEIRAVAVIVFIGGVLLPALDMVRLHPYQYTAFNRASGGMRMAKDNFMLDYWGLAFKQASIELHRALKAGSETPPRGRRWVVAVCGPQPAADVELGPQFETTYDQKKADFAMALGTFYCRHLQAPIIETIMRDGVVYATVYDFRGRASERLVTEPPP